MKINEIISNKKYSDFETYIVNNKVNDLIIQEAIYLSIDEATKNDDLTFIKKIFDLGIDINKKHDFLDEDLLSTDLIGFAVKNNLLELTVFLLEKGANPNSVNNGHSLLTQAVSRKYNDIAIHLIKNGANVNLDNQPSLLNIAIVNNDVSMVNFLIENNVKIQVPGQSDPLLLSLGISKDLANIILQTEYHFEKDYLIEGEKPVEAFSIYDNLDIELYEKIIIKIAKEIDINYSIDYGVPAIHKLVMSGNMPFIKILIENGMDINKKIIKEETKFLEGCSPLFLSVHLGKEHIMRELIKLGADVNTSSLKYSSALALSLHNGNGRIFDYLVKNGADINEDIVKNDDSQMNVIHYVAQYNRPEMMSSLLHIGEDIDRKAYSKNEIFNEVTPLMISVYYSSIDNIKFLLENKANINYQNSNGYSAVAYAAITGQKEIFNLLIQYGANTDIKVKGKELVDLVKIKSIKKEIIAINRKNKNIFWFIKKYLTLTYLLSKIQ